jgi:hypothetical protein
MSRGDIGAGRLVTARTGNPSLLAARATFIALDIGGGLVLTVADLDFAFSQSVLSQRSAFTRTDNYRSNPSAESGPCRHGADYSEPKHQNVVMCAWRAFPLHRAPG